MAVDYIKRLALDVGLCVVCARFYSMKDSAPSLTQFLRKKNCVYSQFAKYLFCGGITFVVDVATFYLLSWLILPCLRDTDPFGWVIGLFGWTIRPVDGDVLVRNFLINKVAAFIVSNSVAYITNVLFVFSGGRHQRLREVGLFYLFSTLSFVAFTWLSKVLIARFEWDVSWSYFLVFALAMVANFTMRKRFVFKG